MPSDFIDRAKMEAEADEWARTTSVQDMERFHQRRSFLAGAAAYAALLDAETTEEWGVRNPTGYVVSFQGDRGTAFTAAGLAGRLVVSRRVTPWLPSKGGEKRG